VPPDELTIYDEKRNEVSGIIGPLMEGNDLQLACEVKGGKPIAFVFSSIKKQTDVFSPPRKELSSSSSRVATNFWRGYVFMFSQSERITSLK